MSRQDKIYSYQSLIFDDLNNHAYMAVQSGGEYTDGDEVDDQFWIDSEKLIVENYKELLISIRDDELSSFLSNNSDLLRYFLKDEDKD